RPTTRHGRFTRRSLGGITSSRPSALHGGWGEDRSPAHGGTDSRIASDGTKAPGRTTSGRLGCRRGGPPASVAARTRRAPWLARMARDGADQADRPGTGRRGHHEVMAQGIPGSTGRHPPSIRAAEVADGYAGPRCSDDDLDHAPGLPELGHREDW